MNNNKYRAIGLRYPLKPLFILSIRHPICFLLIACVKWIFFFIKPCDVRGIYWQSSISMHAYTRATLIIECPSDVAPTEHEVPSFTRTALRISDIRCGLNQLRYDFCCDFGAAVGAGATSLTATSGKSFRGLPCLRFGSSKRKAAASAAASAEATRAARKRLLSRSSLAAISSGDNFFANELI